VLGNSTRAGDPAGWHEQADGSRPALRAESQQSCSLATPIGAPAETGSGTIVILAFINQPCSPGCLVRAATMVTEAKSAAVLDLRMPSLQSSGLATGTGTDQLAIAAPQCRDGEWERQWAGSHNTLGELLARATQEAVTRCLLLQNGVCAELRRTIPGALGRFGCDQAALLACAHSELDSGKAALFERNLLAILHDPLSAAAAYAFAEVVDLTRVGIIQPDVAIEALLNQAAQIAAAVAVAPDDYARYRRELAVRQSLPPDRLAALAVVLGFAGKWETAPVVTP
jgi:hypothetical protein